MRGMRNTPQDTNINCPVEPGARHQQQDTWPATLSWEPVTGEQPCGVDI